MTLRDVGAKFIGILGYLVVIEVIIRISNILVGEVVSQGLLILAAISGLVLLAMWLRSVKQWIWSTLIAQWREFTPPYSKERAFVTGIVSFCVSLGYYISMVSIFSVRSPISVAVLENSNQITPPIISAFGILFGIPLFEFISNIFMAFPNQSDISLLIAGIVLFIIPSIFAVVGAINAVYVFEQIIHRIVN